MRDNCNLFIDKTDIYIKSGHGGAGSIHFRHEKFVAKGGPDGGDGGKGGDIIFICNDKLTTLHNFNFKRHFIAADGKKGGKNNCHGKDADNIIIEVPLGTMIYKKDNHELIIDLNKNGQQFTILHGGKGGLGNSNFKTSTNQTPRYAQEGIAGEEMNITLELKLLADVGLVGFPNAGKSTLLSVVSKAKPAIADYAFTTLSPNLGIVNHKNKSFTMADLPGLIENASSGKGLGFNFLKHIERIKILIFVIDVTSNITKSLDILRNELKNYNAKILDKKQIICLSKCDLLNGGCSKNISKNKNLFYISAHMNAGINELLDEIIKNL